MLKLTPQTMNEGMVTSILITDDNFREVIEISPIPFEKIIQEDIKKIISLYYLKKKTCENLIQQLELAQLEFEEVKADFDSLIRSEPNSNLSNKEKKPEIETNIVVKMEPKSIESAKIIVPEPIIKHESIVSAPEPAPKSLEEITTSIINSPDFKALITNNQLSDTTIKLIIVKTVKPELLDTVYDMVITQLKDTGIIEPTFFEKIENMVKKKPGRKSKDKETKT